MLLSLLPFTCLAIVLDDAAFMLFCEFASPHCIFSSGVEWCADCSICLPRLCCILQVRCCLYWCISWLQSFRCLYCECTADPLFLALFILLFVAAAVCWGIVVPFFVCSVIVTDAWAVETFFMVLLVLVAAAAAPWFVVVVVFIFVRCISGCHLL